tara:strand:- start:206 stop:427 length:222 start_codon:yes stop_codon:yes gene_type:complete
MKFINKKEFTEIVFSEEEQKWIKENGKIVIRHEAIKHFQNEFAKIVYELGLNVAEEHKKLMSFDGQEITSNES